METFLSVILIIIIGFYLVGKLLKIFVPIWIRKKMKDFEQGKGPFNNGGTGGANSQGAWSNFGNRNRQSQESKKEEGDVTITKTKDEDRNINKEIGEYVDFDEVK